MVSNRFQAVEVEIQIWEGLQDIWRGTAAGVAHDGRPAEWLVGRPRIDLGGARFNRGRERVLCTQLMPQLMNEGVEEAVSGGIPSRNVRVCRSSGRHSLGLDGRAAHRDLRSARRAIAARSREDMPEIVSSRAEHALVVQVDLVRVHQLELASPGVTGMLALREPE